MASVDMTDQGYAEVPGDYTEQESNEYFQSYDSLEVHELMLKDRPRTLAYKNFIEQNAELFKDKVVIDVGAGTGILSLFAAKAGAKKVFAIEASGISQVCEVLVAQNGFSDKIEVINEQVENVTLPGDIKADILISEWMGFYLLHESMLTSVLSARDRLLSRDGIILPSSAAIYICPVSMKEHFNENFLFWQNVYGFDFSPVLPAVQQKRLSKPEIISLKSEQMLSTPELVTYLDLRHLEVEDLLEILGTFTFIIEKNSILHGFACWFDVEFEGSTSINLSTGPSSMETHWKQTVVLLPQPLLVSKGEEVHCSLALEQDSTKPRFYTISIGIPEAESSEDDGDDENEIEEDGVGNGALDLIVNAMQTS